MPNNKEYYKVKTSGYFHTLRGVSMSLTWVCIVTSVQFLLVPAYADHVEGDYVTVIGQGCFVPTSTCVCWPC